MFLKLDCTFIFGIKFCHENLAPNIQFKVFLSKR